MRRSPRLLAKAALSQDTPTLSPRNAGKKRRLTAKVASSVAHAPPVRAKKRARVVPSPRRQLQKKRATVFPNFAEEEKLYQLGFKRVVGVDEAGRGPLAGKLVLEIREPAA